MHPIERDTDRRRCEAGSRLQAPWTVDELRTKVSDRERTAAGVSTRSPRRRDRRRFWGRLDRPVYHRSNHPYHNKTGPAVTPAPRCVFYGHCVTILTDECAIKDETGDGRDKRGGGREGVDLRARTNGQRTLEEPLTSPDGCVKVSATPINTTTPFI